MYTQLRTHSEYMRCYSFRMDDQFLATKPLLYIQYVFQTIRSILQTGNSHRCWALEQYIIIIQYIIMHSNKKIIFKFEPVVPEIGAFKHFELFGIIILSIDMIFFIVYFVSFCIILRDGIS